MTSYAPLRKQEWLVCRPEKSTLLALLHEQPQAFELREGADAPAWLRMARQVGEAVCYVHSQGKNSLSKSYITQQTPTQACTTPPEPFCCVCTTTVPAHEETW